MAASEQYRQAWLQGDTATALGLVSDDIRIFISGVPDIRGAEAARGLFVQEMATYRVSALTLDRQDLIVGGDHAGPTTKPRCRRPARRCAEPVAT